MLLSRPLVASPFCKTALAVAARARAAKGSANQSAASIAAHPHNQATAAEAAAVVAVAAAEAENPPADAAGLAATAVEEATKKRAWSGEVHANLKAAGVARSNKSQRCGNCGNFAGHNARKCPAKKNEIYASMSYGQRAKLSVGHVWPVG